MGKRDGPITNGDEKRIGATQQSNETGGRLKKRNKKTPERQQPEAGDRKNATKKAPQAREADPSRKTGKKPGSRNEAAKSEDTVTAKRRMGGAEQPNNRLKNRVDATGQKQPGGRNSQDAWAIRKNLKNRGTQRGNKPARRPNLEVQGGNQSGRLRRATTTGKRNEATKTQQKRDLGNDARKTLLARERRRNYARRPSGENRPGKTQEGIGIHLSKEKAFVRRKRASVRKTGAYPRRRPENAPGS